VVLLTPSHPPKSHLEINVRKRKAGKEEEAGGKRQWMDGAEEKERAPASPMRRLLSPPNAGPEQQAIPPKVEVKKEPADPAVQRARVASDLKLATVEDIHGNCPLHTAVLLGNMKLVRRFAAVLAALGWGVDLANRAGMVRGVILAVGCSGRFLYAGGYSKGRDKS
jgi:hypothetical protein